MATITAANRARILMDLTKDGEVTDLANYANVEMLAGVTALEIANDFWEQYGQQLYEEDGTTPRDPTNEELATHYINRIRQFHKETRAANRLKKNGVEARDAERILVDAANTTDFGDDE